MQKEKHKIRPKSALCFAPYLKNIKVMDLERDGMNIRELPILNKEPTARGPLHLITLRPVQLDL